MRKSKAAAPTDEVIIVLDNVPVELAAQYIKQSTCTVSVGWAPFGFASLNEKTGTWTYNISPGLLIAYKRGSLPMYRIDDIQRMAADGITRIIDQRLTAINRAVGILAGGAS